MRTCHNAALCIHCLSCKLVFCISSPRVPWFHIFKIQKLLAQDNLLCDIIWLKVFYSQAATKSIKILSMQHVATLLMQCFLLLLKVHYRETGVFMTWKKLVDRKGVRTIYFFHSHTSIPQDMNIAFWVTVLTYITPPPTRNLIRCCNFHTKLHQTLYDDWNHLSGSWIFFASRLMLSVWHIFL
jgi:hypothetical protein